MSIKPLNIGIIGLGTVGTGLIEFLSKNKKIIFSRTERAINILAICAKSKNKKRKINVNDFKWVEDPFDITDDKEIDVVVELIGGEEDPAKSIVEKSLLNKKHVVTANKALLSKHGHYLALLAEEQQVSLNFEAAVAGGIIARSRHVSAASTSKMKFRSIKYEIADEFTHHAHASQSVSSSSSESWNGSPPIGPSSGC